VLRVEDLDGPRVKAGASAEAIELLKWLGIDWDEGPFFQLADLTPYENALRQLAAQGAIYPCRCTRKALQQASLSAPHGHEHDLRYPGTCRPADGEASRLGLLGASGVAWRVRVPEEPTAFDDAFAGQQTFNVQQTVGDFLVATKSGLTSYQLAVVVDDARQGIDQVVRGDDLLASTPRQMLLYAKLGLGPPPTYTHVPLVLGEDGRRLAKRHGDSRLVHYQSQGVAAERVIGLLAEWCGLGPRRARTTADFLEQFQMAKIPADPIVFTAADDAWLLAK
jgi:glutamyl-tRNA synthetase